MKLSEIIKQFLDACENYRKLYDFNFEVVGKCDKITCDFLHNLELNKSTTRERSKLTTAERKNRIERRKAKDIVETTEPLKNFLNTPEGIKAIKMLKQVLGETRKAEKYHENRVYIDRNKD